MVMAMVIHSAPFNLVLRLLEWLATIKTVMMVILMSIRTQQNIATGWMTIAILLLMREQLIWSFTMWMKIKMVTVVGSPSFHVLEGCL